MGGVYVGVLLVAGLQFLRSRERRLLPLMALFGLLAAAHTHGPAKRWGKPLHLGAGAAGLALVFVLSPRTPRQP